MDPNDDSKWQHDQQRQPSNQTHSYQKKYTFSLHIETYSIMRPNCLFSIQAGKQSHAKDVAYGTASKI
jgi:hypothetical protein